MLLFRMKGSFCYRKPRVCSFRRLAAAVVSFLLFFSGHANEESLPEGTGIASKSRHDGGIIESPAVIFVDDFEDEGTLEKRWNQKWSNGGIIELTESADQAHRGKRALRATLSRPGDQSCSVGIRKFLEKGHDTLFFRYYAKYSRETDLYHGSTHNAGSIAARLPGELDQSYAGVFPDGKNLYSIVLDTWRSKAETPSPGPVVFYCYHMDQGHQWGDHFFPSGKVMPGGRDLFGDSFVPREDFVPELGRWYCYEMMIRANTPGKPDGRAAFWVDGKLTGDFPNLRFREVAHLKPNRIGFGLYTANKRVTRDVTMWFDDVVVATKYIGPMRKQRTPAP